MTEPASDLLRVENLKISFHVPSGVIPAVKNASLRVLPGKVTALSLIHISEPTRRS